MNAADREKVIARYSERFAKYGYSPETLGWTKGREALRFEILLSQWVVKGAEVLDFGCGFGDLYGHCRARGLDVRYEGVDLNPLLVEAGRKIYPEASLRAADLLEEAGGKMYDFIFSSGTHNVPLEDNWGFIERTFDFFSSRARRGFAANFLSDKVSYTTDSFHADPARVLGLAYRHSNRVVLRNDYMPFEFTVFVDKRAAFDPGRAVYPEFTGRPGA